MKMIWTLSNPFLSLPMLCWEEPGEGTPSAVSAGTAGNDTVVTEGNDTTVTGEGDTLTSGNDTQDSGNDTVVAAEPVTMDQITLPEGFAIPEEAQEGFLAVVNDPELSRADIVNKLIEMQSEASLSNADALQEALSRQFTETQTEWQKQLSALPVLGGDRLPESLAEVKTGLEASGATKEVFDALDVTGAGNHPALVQLLHKLTEPYREAAPVTPSPQDGKLSREARMFPSMTQGS